VSYGSSVKGHDVGMLATVSGSCNATWYLSTNTSAQVLVHLTYLLYSGKSDIYNHLRGDFVLWVTWHLTFNRSAVSLNLI